MLMALEVPIKFQLYAHGHLLIKGNKMSKSKENVVYPMDLVNHYGLDPLRLYLVKEMSLGYDGNFTYERYIEKYNIDLANDLGNLVSRTLAMINKYYQGLVKKTTYINDLNRSVEEMIAFVISEYQKYFDDFRFQDGLNQVWSLINRANKYIDETSPWVLAKSSETALELQTVLYHLYEILRLVAIMISPVMPKTAHIILEELGLTKENIKIENLTYGKVLEAVVTSKPIVLFKRLDLEQELKKY